MSDIKVQVCVFAFDLLFLNGRVSGSHSTASDQVAVTAYNVAVTLSSSTQSLVREPLKTRRELLRSSFNEIHGV